jgi:hypothetical protein
MSGLKKRTWHGDRIIRASRTSNREAIELMSEEVAKEMRRAAHVQTGALRRSIGVAAPGTNGSVRGSETRVVGRGEWALEVGSWLPYACVENNRGGMHRFADIGWATARPRFRKILRAAWKTNPGT